MKILLLALLFSPFLTGCAVLYHVQVSDVEGAIVDKGKRFEIILSETGVNLREATSIAKSLTQHKETQSRLKEVNDIISLFQMGPRTGNMVFNDNFTDDLVYAIREQCPQGRVTSLMSIREMRKYPVVSGEIVKIVGYCLPGERG